MNSGSEENEILLKGIVIPLDWDHDGKVRTIGVLTDGEGEYEVAPGGVGDQLKHYVRREILAEAVPLDTVGRVKQVLVNYFALLDWVGPDDSKITPRGPDRDVKRGLS
jgi:hypothetical protein